VSSGFDSWIFSPYLFDVLMRLILQYDRWRILKALYRSKTTLHSHKKPKWVFGQYFVNSSLNPTILVTYHVVNTLMMRT
jgi:hypothetical protein